MKLIVKLVAFIYVDLLCVCNTIGDETTLHDDNSSTHQDLLFAHNNKPISNKIFTNKLSVQVKSEESHDQASKHSGFAETGRTGGLGVSNFFDGSQVVGRSIEPSYKVKYSNDYKQVEWFEQQDAKQRFRRDLTPDLTTSLPTAALEKDLEFLDPLYKEQWYFNKGAKGSYDLNVAAVWKMNITGKGVVVAVVDDGVQVDHPDLIRNYDRNASYDFIDNDDDPSPQDYSDSHGTRCAGEIAAEAGNEFCGVGVAYNAKIGGIRIPLSGKTNDRDGIEARALSFRSDYIDIYSSSWGVTDDGKSLGGPGPLASQAFVDSVRNGRKGRGSIFVWSSGNGGEKYDNCNCDGYTNSIYTLSVSSATRRGHKPRYSEECSSTLTTTYSGGKPMTDENILTTDQSHEYEAAKQEGRKPDPTQLCTQEHTGTSASAPIAAGIIALALEANPELTWRDMQHIVVQTSRYKPLRYQSGWIQNAVGRRVSHKFGYGLMDAEAIVKAASRWKTTPPQVVCETAIDNEERVIRDSLEVTVNTSACAGSNSAVNYLEHVEARISLKFQPRGDIKITLVSPSGTPSNLLMFRPRDNVADSFDKWPFMTVHFWGEKPQGIWKIMIEKISTLSDGSGVLYSWSLKFYGTTTQPQESLSPMEPDTQQVTGVSRLIDNP